MSWMPLLTGAEADRARAIVAVIADELRTHVEREGLDEPWMALLFSYRAEIEGRAEDAGTAARMLALAVDELAEVPLAAELHGGYVATAFVAAQLARARGEAVDDEDFAEIDDALIDELEVDARLWRGRHDLIQGLAGLGCYALERLPSPAARRCLVAVVDQLEASAEPREAGLCWTTPPRRWPGPPPEDQPARDDLGLAHGVAGVLAVLARAHAAGVRPARTRALVEGAVAWLAAQQLPDTAAISGAGLPHWVGEDVEPCEARQAWCYGALGISTTVLTAARCLGRPDWEALARGWALAEARREPASTGIVDPYFCHGCVGAAHLFNRLYQATGDRRLGAAARAWLRRTVAHYQPGEGIAGFRPLLMPRRGVERDAFVENRGILMGVTGIGLGLLASTTTNAPSWDRALQVEIPALSAEKVLPHGGDEIGTETKT